MPLLPGRNPQTISHNILEMVKAGHPHDQAVAAALSNAYGRKQKKDKKATAKPPKAQGLMPPPMS